MDDDVELDLLEELGSMVGDDNKIYEVKEFLQAHPGLNLNSQVHPPLFEAPDEDILQLLLRHGANINLQIDDSNITPLHHLIIMEPIDGELSLYAKIENFLNAGANPNLKDESGETPLHYAKNHIMTKLLLKYGANPNVRNDDGNTPLHMARDYRQAKVLLRYGADPTIRNRRRKTPLEEVQNEMAKKLIREVENNLLLLSKSKRASRRSGERREPLREFSTHPYYDERLWRMILEKYGKDKF